MTPVIKSKLLPSRKKNDCDAIVKIQKLTCICVKGYSSYLPSSHRVRSVKPDLLKSISVPYILHKERT